MASKTTAVAVKEEAKLPATSAGFDYGDYADYQDGPSADEMLIPFISILQPMSPEVTDGEIEGAKAGMFYNSVTGELTEELIFQAVYFERLFVEWRPRESGGGIVGKHSPNDPLITRLMGEGDKYKLFNGENPVQETIYVYGNILGADGSEVEGFGVMPVKSTGLKAVKAWRTSMNMIKGLVKPPVFAFRTKLTAAKQKNDQGTWWQLQAKPVGPTWKESLINPVDDAALLQAGVGFLDMIRSGVAKADEAKEAQAGPSGGSDSEIPF